MMIPLARYLNSNGSKFVRWMRTEILMIVAGQMLVLLQKQVNKVFKKLTYRQKDVFLPKLYR